MYKHILVPTDGSELSEKAILVAVNLAKTCGAKLTGFFLTDVYWPSPFADYPVEVGQQFRTQQAERAKVYLNIVERDAKAAGVAYDIYSRAKVSPHEGTYEGILEAVEQRGCDLIVMASHGRRGVKGLVLGSETHKVLVHSKIPVLVVR